MDVHKIWWKSNTIPAARCVPKRLAEMQIINAVAVARIMNCTPILRFSNRIPYGKIQLTYVCFEMLTQLCSFKPSLSVFSLHIWPFHMRSGLSLYEWVTSHWVDVACLWTRSLSSIELHGISIAFPLRDSNPVWLEKGMVVVLWLLRHTTWEGGPLDWHTFCLNDTPKLPFVVHWANINK